jgi:RNA polymerase sigma-70 factor (family 1)
MCYFFIRFIPIACILIVLPNHKLYTERELLERIAKGDEIALSTIYQQYWKPLFIQAYNIIRDKMVCEDIVQEIFLQLWRNRGSLQITDSLNSYLHAATRYQVFHYIRRNPVMEHLFENIGERISGEYPGHSLIEKDLHGQIDQVISRLPEKCRLIYKLSREEYLPHKEIAARLHISIKTVENQLTIALRRLRLSLKDAIMLAMIFLFEI